MHRKKEILLKEQESALLEKQRQVLEETNRIKQLENQKLQDKISQMEKLINKNNKILSRNSTNVLNKTVRERSESDIFSSINKLKEKLNNKINNITINGGVKGINNTISFFNKFFFFKFASSFFTSSDIMLTCANDILSIILASDLLFETNFYYRAYLLVPGVVVSADFELAKLCVICVIFESLPSSSFFASDISFLSDDTACLASHI